MDSFDRAVQANQTFAVIDKHARSQAGCPAPFLLDIVPGEWTRRAETWCDPNPEETTLVRKTLLTLAVDACHRHIPWVVMEIDEAPDAFVFDLIPDHFGMDTSIVQRLRRVVAQVKSEPLRDFLSNVFSLSMVYRHFWKCPASQWHHHAYAGGLAIHSIEMAEWMADTPELSGTDRDIGVVFALLHDIGKLWCYGEREFTHYQDLTHELTGVAKISQPLDALDAAWPHGFVVLTSLLSGLWKSKRDKPLLAIGEIVQRYDQSSVRRDLRNQKGARHQRWNAKPCAGNVRPIRPDWQ